MFGLASQVICRDPKVASGGAATDEKPMLMAMHLLREKPAMQDCEYLEKLVECGTQSTYEGDRLRPNGVPLKARLNGSQNDG